MDNYGSQREGCTKVSVGDRHHHSSQSFGSLPQRDNKIRKKTSGMSSLSPPPDTCTNSKTIKQTRRECVEWIPPPPLPFRGPFCPMSLQAATAGSRVAFVITHETIPKVTAAR